MKFYLGDKCLSKGKYISVNIYWVLTTDWGFPGGSELKTPSANAVDVGLIPGFGIFPGEGNGNPVVFFSGKFHGQRSLVGSVHGVRKSWIWLSNYTITKTPEFMSSIWTFKTLNKQLKKKDDHFYQFLITYYLVLRSVCNHSPLFHP